MKQSFLGSILIMSMSVVFLVTFTYATTFTYEVLFEEERLESTAQIASVNVGEMSREEARLILEDEVRQWQEQGIMEVTWFDEVIALPGNVVEFQIDETLDRYFDGEPVEEGIITNARAASIEDQLREFRSPENIMDLVDMNELTNQLENQTSTLDMEIVIPLHTVLEPHHQMTEEVTTVIERNVEQGPLLTDWLSSEPTIEVDPYEVIHLSEFIYPFNGGEMMNVVSSGVYEAVLNMDFEIVERHIREQRYLNVPLGYDAFINENDGMDIVFRNPMDVPYTISFHDVLGGFEVRITGFELPYQLEVLLDEESTVEPKTRVTYSNDLPAEEVTTTENGTEGEFVRVVRSRFNEFGELLEEEEISRDFYKPEHRLEVRSNREPEPEPEPEDNGNGSNGPDNGNGGFPPPPDENDDYDDWDDYWNDQDNRDDNGDWDDNGNGQSPPPSWWSPSEDNDNANDNDNDNGNSNSQNGGYYDDNGTYVPPSTDDEGNLIKGH